MENCIFCKIAAGEIPGTKVYEDDKIVAFRDIKPAAKVHIIIIPKFADAPHITSANAITPENASIAAYIFAKIPSIAKTLGISESGYRVITNVGEDAGQTVPHIHFHLLGGEKLPLF